MKTVHYIFDPMCGWCYGASPLIESLNAMPELHLSLHPGGMLTRQTIADPFRQHILKADERIAQITGQYFGQAYRERLHHHEPLILDSYITAQAILAADTSQNLGFSMLKKIQEAHYQDGKTVAESATLAQLAQELGINADDWSLAMKHVATSLEGTIQRTRTLMEEWQLSGFPSMMIEYTDGKLQFVPLNHYYNDTPSWLHFWETIINER